MCRLGSADCNDPSCRLKWTLESSFKPLSSNFSLQHRNTVYTTIFYYNTYIDYVCTLLCIVW